MEATRRGLRPRTHAGCTHAHADKWNNIESATGSTNALQDMLVDSRLRCISNRAAPRSGGVADGTILGGKCGSQLGRLYFSWEKCSRFCSQTDAEEHLITVSGARRELRNHPLVANQLERYWEVMLNTYPIVAQHRPRPAVQWQEYRQLQLRMHKALLAGFDEDEADELIERDWTFDLGGEESLKERDFCSSVFAVADHFTLGVHPAEYASFLSLLYESIVDDNDNRDVFSKLPSIRYADLSKAAHERFALLSPRGKASVHVYRASTTAATTREMQSKAAREAAKAEPQQRSSGLARATCVVPTSSGLIDGRLPPRNIKGDIIPKGKLRGALLVRPPGQRPDPLGWYLRAEQWFLERSKIPTIGATPSFILPCEDFMSSQSSKMLPSAWTTHMQVTDKSSLVPVPLAPASPRGHTMRPRSAMAEANYPAGKIGMRSHEFPGHVVPTAEMLKASMGRSLRAADIAWAPRPQSARWASI